MYRAMIIDDEEIVRWGIRDLMDWETEGFSLCEDGRDGRDGLKKLLDSRPDLALVDIKMPGISGIELIRQAREAGFGGHFVILTGYSEFEFAKAAISLGVEEYLLKPVDEEELARCVRKIYGKLEEQSQEERRRSEGDAREREALLGRVLLHAGAKEELQEQMGRCGLSFGEDILCVAILSDGGAEQGDFAGKCREFLKDSSLCQQSVWMDGRMVLVGSGMDDKTWAGKLSARNARIRSRYGEGLVIAVGNPVGHWYELYHSYQFAKFMMEQEFLLGQGDVLSMQAIEEQRRKAENPPAEYFLMLAEVGDLEGIREGVEKFRTWCIRNFKTETDVKVQVLYNLMTIQNSIEKKYGSCEDGQAGRDAANLKQTEKNEAKPGQTGRDAANRNLIEKNEAKPGQTGQNGAERNLAGKDAAVPVRTGENGAERNLAGKDAAAPVRTGENGTERNLAGKDAAAPVRTGQNGVNPNQAGYGAADQNPPEKKSAKSNETEQNPLLHSQPLRNLPWQMEKLNQAEQLDEVLELYAAILEDICLRIGTQGSDTVIKRMYYYMEKNYGQEMKLESFARMFNYNANYLGKIFRKEIGDSFNNILDSIRIANAKRLLEETDLKVYQISEQVGYKNIDYFYLKFRKYVGISPKEYQKEIADRVPDGERRKNIGQDDFHRSAEL